MPINHVPVDYRRALDAMLEHKANGTDFIHVRSQKDKPSYLSFEIDGEMYSGLFRFDLTKYPYRVNRSAFSGRTFNGIQSQSFALDCRPEADFPSLVAEFFRELQDAWVNAVKDRKTPIESCCGMFSRKDGELNHRYGRLKIDWKPFPSKHPWKVGAGTPGFMVRDYNTQEAVGSNRTYALLAPADGSKPCYDESTIKSLFETLDVDIHHMIIDCSVMTHMNGKHYFLPKARRLVVSASEPVEEKVEDDEEAVEYY